MSESPQRLIITVLGMDKVGIVARISAFCAEHDMNIVDTSQTIMQDMFTMIMVVEMQQSSLSVGDIGTKLAKIGTELALEIHVQDERIIRAMQRV